MSSIDMANECNGATELIQVLEQDRSWLLRELDAGKWPELRLDLAALERELGQLLELASEKSKPN
ncbi:MULTISPECIES: hypothetical protein [unclassified Synechococcus]|jgi:hypothetical protein|uniref:hypothetical protein n=1 Tax=unclassified Synechococcus TaxID=2626047 RepID=UPI0020CDE5C5|nr:MULTISPECIES: hypothetical protein [unclassified Synechococcus]MDA0290414.1 hypothetical protein [Cyanobacteriota bacterium]